MLTIVLRIVEIIIKCSHHRYLVNQELRAKSVLVFTSSGTLLLFPCGLSCAGVDISKLRKSCVYRITRVTRRTHSEIAMKTSPLPSVEGPAGVTAEDESMQLSQLMWENLWLSQLKKSVQLSLLRKSVKLSHAEP